VSAAERAPASGGRDRLLIGSSVKMHLSVEEVRAWLPRCADLLSPIEGVELFVLPPFVCLQMAADLLRGSRVAHGAQNMHWEERGAYTGEVSPTMIRAFGGTFVELGHAERRRHFGETDETVNLKVRSALRHGLRPIVCVGESTRSAASADDTVGAQVRRALGGVAPNDLDRVVVAYEPVWAIGQPQAAEPGYVFDRHRAIRATLVDLYGDAAGTRPTLIYGGSVAPDNAAELTADPSVQGLFVGRAALRPEGFREIVLAAVGARGD
jgi:L-erythrulose 1-phosphate isomerase